MKISATTAEAIIVAILVLIYLVTCNIDLRRTLKKKAPPAQEEHLKESANRKIGDT